MSLLKSIVAIIAGVFFTVATHMGIDTILEAAGIFPPPEQGLHVTWMLVVASLYRTGFQVGGGYLTAVLAPSRPMLHGIILGLIGLISALAAAIAVIPMNLSPAWYPIALVIVAFPSVWLGAWLRSRSKI